VRILALALFCFPALAQTSITLTEAVERAMKHPSVTVSVKQADAAAAAIALARTAYLPRADVLAQLNRATRNNIFGLLLPHSTLPSISGPPKPENDMANVWGSAVGFLVSWEPFDFGLRRANVDVAEAGRRRAMASAERVRFENSVAAADAYLTAIAAEQMLRAAQAQLDRARAVETVVAANVNADLRPGADLSRSRAETASAEVQIARAEEAVAVSSALLEHYTGAGVKPVAGRITEELPGLPVATGSVPPAIREQQAALAEVEARQHALDRSWYPRFHAQASSYARGTGANPDGSVGGPVTGIGPNIYNWAVGMSVTFPVWEWPSLRARREIERHRRDAEAAREEQLRLDLKTQGARASAALASARRVAEKIPLQLEAARAGERQARARYDAGLSALVELADAQRLLTQSEIDYALARLNVWRALLAVGAAEGDLGPFLKAVERTP
jgi:outer membrane protein TolC